jgi:hypothetical protein
VVISIISGLFSAPGLTSSAIAPEEPAHRIAEPAVPNRPTVAREVGDLIEPCGVPGFGDHLGARKYRISLDVE